jgi:hypothetical protein
MKILGLPEQAFLAGGLGAAALYALLAGADAASPSRVLLAATAALALLATAARIRAGGSEAHRAFVPVIGGMLAIGLLGFGMGGSAVRFDLSGPGGFHLPGAGWVSGLMLLSALGGTLLLTAHGLSTGTSVLAPVLGYRALMLAGGLGVITSGLLSKEALASTAPGVGPWGAGVGAASLLLLVGTQPWSPARDGAAVLTARARRLEVLGAGVCVLALLATGGEQWMGRGAYLTDVTRAGLVAALAGLAAAQDTRLALVRALVFAAAALAALVTS